MIAKIKIRIKNSAISDPASIAPQYDERMVSVVPKNTHNMSSGSDIMGRSSPDMVDGEKDVDVPISPMYN